MNPFINKKMFIHQCAMCVCVCVCVCVLVPQSCPALCDPMECSLPGSSVHGIHQTTTHVHKNTHIHIRSFRKPQEVTDPKIPLSN